MIDFSSRYRNLDLSKSREHLLVPEYPQGSENAALLLIFDKILSLRLKNRFNLLHFNLICSQKKFVVIMYMLGGNKTKANLPVSVAKNDPTDVGYDIL